MYRFRGCNCMNSNNKVLEDVCADYTNEMHTNCNCDDCMAKKESCQCGFDEEYNVFPSNPMLAQSYVPIQTMNKTFTPCCGLKNGTIFPELVSPYEPCQSMQFINYLKNRNNIGEGCNG